jgi:TatD DNase family protein
MLLQDIVRGRMRSLLQYISESFPWPNTDSEAAAAVFQALAGEERDAVAPLVQFLVNEGDSIPYCGAYPMQFTNMNFVSMAYIAPIVQSYLREAVVQLERDMSKLQNPHGGELVQSLIETLERHLQRLELLQTDATLSSAAIQPNNLVDVQPQDWDEVVQLANTHAINGIGETGLDRYWKVTPFDQQEEYFARHLKLARRLDLPIVIHCRQAEADIIRMVREDFERQGPVRGVMHSFTGDWITVDACLAMGLHISFAGMLTFKNSQNLRKVAAKVPLDRLLVETDSPYLAPVPMRGKRNEPAFVEHTAACLANLLGISFDVLAERTTANARQLFKLS